MTADSVHNIGSTRIMEERQVILQVNLTSGQQNVMQIIALRFYIKKIHSGKNYLIMKRRRCTTRSHWASKINWSPKNDEAYYLPSDHRETRIKKAMDIKWFFWRKNKYVLIPIKTVRIILKGMPKKITMTWVSKNFFLSQV